MITLVGLGCEPAPLPPAAQTAAEAGADVVFRTLQTPVSAASL